MCPVNELQHNKCRQKKLNQVNRTSMSLTERGKKTKLQFRKFQFE